MSDIIFKKNKLKYLFFSLILLAIILFALYFGILFIANPSKYIYTLMPNEIIVFLVGILGVLGSLVLLYILIKGISNRHFYIKINADGLFIGIIQYSNKLIKWNDITQIETINIDGIEHIIIYIKNIEYYQNKEKGIQKYFFISRTKKYGSPFVINTSALSDKSSEIINSMLLNWERFK